MGRPKALLRRGGRTLIEHLVAIVRECDVESCLLGAPPFELPSSLAGLSRLDDRHPGIGPIAGLDSLLAVHPDRGAVLLSCDLPRLGSAILRRLLDARSREPDADAIAFATAPPPDGWEPCCALYRPSIRPELDRAIQEHRYSLQQLLGVVRSITLDASPAEREILLNLNRPEDLPTDWGDEPEP